MAGPFLSEIINDPDLAEAFTIIRSSGSFASGGWRNVQTNIKSYGVIDNAQGQDLEMIPEGDRVLGAIVIHTEAPMYVSHEDPVDGVNSPGISDIVVWHGQQWRLMHVSDRSNRGYYSAVAVRMAGQ